MSAIISLPLFDRSVSHATLDQLLEEIEMANPKLAEDVHTWATLRNLDVGNGPGLSLRVAALASAVTKRRPRESGHIGQVRARLEWLEHDLALAPRLISQPVLLADRTGVGLEANVQPLIVGAHFTWSSTPYLLGVLLGELHRNEGLQATAVEEIDRIGFLDLRDLDIGAVIRTVASIVLGDTARDLSPASTSGLIAKHGLHEQTQFSQLQRLLAPQSYCG